MTCQLLTGDAATMLRTLPDASVQCVVTSPPYFGLRSYLPEDHPDRASEIGNESSLHEYVSHLLSVFTEVKRVLRANGVVWLNLGDSFVTNASTSNIPRSEQGNGQGKLHIPGEHNVKARRQTPNRATTLIHEGLKKKDLMGIPWRVAFALQDAGWWLRSEVILAKANPMPESVTDRPTCSHESLFLLTKSETYYYDADAIAEPVVKGYAGSSFVAGKTLVHASNRSSLRSRKERETRNKRDVWHYQAENYEGAHYAVMPSNVIEPCILAGSRSGDVVLDPFMGTASVGKVALSHGRSFIGIDLDERNIEQARHRIGPMLLDEPLATTPPARVVDKQAGTGRSFAVGFNARWDAQEVAS